MIERKYEIKGTFLDEKQEILEEIFLDNFDDTNQGILKLDNCLYLKPDPDNEHDKNAIAIYDKEYGMLGYIPRESTDDFRGLFNLERSYEADLIIKKANQYTADIVVKQKEDKVRPLMFIASLLIPLVGFVYFISNRKKNEKSSKVYLIVSLISLIAGILKSML